MWRRYSRFAGGIGRETWWWWWYYEPVVISRLATRAMGDDVRVDDADVLYDGDAWLVADVDQV